MPSLAETQTPFLLRDKQSGLLPQRFGEEELWQYHIRLSQLYGVPLDEVVRILKT